MDDQNGNATYAAPVAVNVVKAAHRLGVETVRRYHRLELSVPEQPIEDPVLFVANHGFGGVFDLNVFAAYAAFENLGLTRPVSALTHQIAWTLGVGELLESVGSRPALASRRGTRSRQAITCSSCRAATSTQRSRSPTGTRSSSRGGVASRDSPWTPVSRSCRWDRWCRRVAARAG